MTTRRKSTVFHVTGLDSSKTDEALDTELQIAIHENLLEQEKAGINVVTAVVPCCDNDEEKVALVEFQGAVPHFLLELLHNSLGDWQIEMGDIDINFDSHFFGFTQLYATKPGEPVTADLIAITGLDGHAYGSWRGKGNLGRMWLRDFLSKDLPHCRTMIYGYNSKLSSHGIDTIMDYGRELLEELKKVRTTKEARHRPLFFIAHSFGGIILAHCLIKAVQTTQDDHPTIACLYKATYGIIFFATPHKGLVVDDIQTMLAEHQNHPRNVLLQQLSDKSDLLISQLADFKNLIRDRKIVSFYETEQNRRLVFDDEKRQWSRSGDFVTALNTDSAILQLPDHIEDKIPLHADHSAIVKFDTKNAPGYKSALSKLREFEQKAPDVVAHRFYESNHRNIKLDELPCAEGAAFDSRQNEHDPRCLEDTRVDFLFEVAQWPKGPQSKCIFWLKGMAGTGKSTISRTVAQSFARKGQLGASFFFKRGEGHRGNASRFFTTIAAQLATKLPDLATHTRKALDENPDIKDKSLVIQFEKLIFQPLSAMRNQTTQSQTPTAVVVIDALDECEQEDDIRTILRLLAQIDQVKSISLRIFVTSRPELPIRMLSYMKSPETIEHDLSTYLRHEFAKIREEQDIISLEKCLSPDWPGDESIQALVEIAIPLFIFAATVCRFVADRRWSPEQRLDIVLNYGRTSQTSKLDQTYLPIMAQLFVDLDEEEKSDLAQGFRDLVGAIVLLADSLPVPPLASLLRISNDDVRRGLSALHSVLDVPNNSVAPVRLFHLSFRDFLVDPQKRDKNRFWFWIDESQAHSRLASKCIELLSTSKNLKQNVCGLQLPGILRAEIDKQTINESLPTEVQYACRYWVHHLKQSHRSIHDDDSVHEFLRQNFLYWLEALSLLGHMSESIMMISDLRSLVAEEQINVSRFLYDAWRFVLQNRWIIDLAPLQLYCSAVVFAPERSVVKDSFANLIPAWIRQLPNVPYTWNPELQKLEVLSVGGIRAVAFSHDGKLLASVTWFTVSLWDATTGEALPSPDVEMAGHLDTRAAAFSHDNKLLATSHVEAIAMWDTLTGTLVRVFKTWCSFSGVDIVTFSHDDKLLAHTSGQTIILWDAKSGQAMRIRDDHDNSILNIAFSRDDKLLMSISEDRIGGLWHCGTGKLTWSNELFNGNLLQVAAISHDRNSVAFATTEKLEY